MKRLLWSWLLLWLPFGLARIALMLLYPEAFSGLGLGARLEAFFRGLAFDFSSLAVFGFFPFLAYHLPGPFKARWWRAPWHLVLALGSLATWGLLLIDLVYFGRVQRHLAFELGNLAGDWGLMAQMVAQGFLLPFLLFVALSLGWLALWLWLWRRPYRPLGWFSWVGLFLVLVLLARGGFAAKPIAVIDAYQGGNAQAANLSLNGVFTTSHAMLMDTEVSHDHLEPQKAWSIAFPQKDPQADFPLLQQAKGGPGAQNLVVILVESLSSYYLDALGGQGYGVTPFLDDLVQNSLTYSDYYASGQRSLEGIQVSLTGVPSLIGLPTLGQGFQARFTSLGALAQQQGHQTLFVQAMERESFRGDSTAAATGFKHYYGKEDFPLLLDYPDRDGAPFGWDHETLQFSLKRMKEFSGPFTAFIVTSTTHEPYPRLPAQFEKYPVDTQSESGFLNSLAYTDWALARFFEEAQKQPWFEDTLFVVTADHALGHYVQGGFLDRFRIPLILHQPSRFSGELRSNIGAQVDLLPTLVEAMGWKASFATMGQSLMGPGPGYAFAREGSLMLLVRPEGYVKHSLEETVAAQKRPEGEGTLAPQQRQEMVQKLLALDQAVFGLLQENRWAP